MEAAVTAIIGILTLLFGSGIAFKIRRRSKRRARRARTHAGQANPVASRTTLQDGAMATNHVTSAQSGAIDREPLSQTGFADSIGEIEQGRNIAATLGETGFDDTIQAIAKMKKVN